MSKVFFEKEFPSTMEAVGDTIASALSALRDHDWVVADGEFQARLCLEEALVNAVTHGNGCNETLTVRIEIEEEADSDCCVIRVLDQGNGFDTEDITLPEADEAGGRGVCLMRYFMDEVVYDEKERCLTMRLRRPEAGRGCT